MFLKAKRREIKDMFGACGFRCCWAGTALSLVRHLKVVCTLNVLICTLFDFVYIYTIHS